MEVTEEELARASLLKTPQQVLALFRKKNETTGKDEIIRSLCLALDGVQDPGNLGTIIRLADWFGIRHIFCSPDTADAYSPKAVQATMGSLARVALHTTDLPTPDPQPAPWERRCTALSWTGKTCIRKN